MHLLLKKLFIVIMKIEALKSQYSW